MTTERLKPCADCVKPEEWRPIAGYEDLYHISSHGRVKCLPRITPMPRGGIRLNPERIRSPGVRTSGHQFVSLNRFGEEPVRASVHHLVLIAFIGPRLEWDVECLGLHRDDCPTHNHPANLYWGTRKQNWLDAVAAGQRVGGQVGLLNPISKLNAEQVREIQASPLSQTELAKIYKVSGSTIWYARNGVSYRDVGR